MTWLIWLVVIAAAWALVVAVACVLCGINRLRKDEADELPPTVELHPDEIRAERWRQWLEQETENPVA